MERIKSYKVLRAFEDVFLASKGNIDEFLLKAKEKALKHNGEKIYEDALTGGDEYLKVLYDSIVNTLYLRPLSSSTYTFKKEELDLIDDVYNKAENKDLDLLTQEVGREISKRHPGEENFYRIYYGLGEEKRTRTVLGFYLADIYPKDKKAVNSKQTERIYSLFGR